MPSLNTNTQQIEIKGNFFNLVKGIYEKPTANILLKGEELPVVALRSGTRQRRPFITSIQHCTRVSGWGLARKRIRRYPD